MSPRRIIGIGFALIAGALILVAEAVVARIPHLEGTAERWILWGAAAVVFLAGIVVYLSKPTTEPPLSPGQIRDRLIAIVIIEVGLVRNVFGPKYPLYWIEVIAIFGISVFFLIRSWPRREPKTPSRPPNDVGFRPKAGGPK